MEADNFISRIKRAGFTMMLRDGNLAISPASQLTDPQRQWIRSHRDELVFALRSSASLLDSDGGNDIPPANDEPVLIHVSEYTVATGERISPDTNMPKVNLPTLKRTSLQFQLKDNGGGGFAQGRPGESEEELRDSLGRKYGDRLESIGGSEP